MNSFINTNDNINVTAIPLSKLVAWDGNVRKTGVQDGIDELAASIGAHGLLQSLVVKPVENKRRKGKRGKADMKYAVVAGQRRLLALTSLAKAGKIGRDAPIPCRVAGGEIDPAELSLAENAVRVPMHPADQFEAFRTVIDNGASVAEVAARFGVTESIVTKRLKLGRLSPVILQAYREGAIALEQAQAFTVTDDQSAQEHVFANLPEWQRDPGDIRDALTQGEIPQTDKRVRFVGIDAYEAAGGPLRRDLFAESGCYVQDAVLLDRLVHERLAEVAQAIHAERWRWVEIHPELEYDALAQFSRVHPEPVPLSDADQAELDRLAEEYDALASDAESDPDNEELAGELERIESRIDALRANGECFTPQALAVAGAIVSLSHRGEVRIERGLVRAEDAGKAGTGRRAGPGGKSEAKPAFSAALVTDLTAHKTAAIAAELARQPDIALAAVVHALALDLLYPGAPEGSLELRTEAPVLRKAVARPDACKGIAALEQERESWGGRLPDNPGDLWQWCLEQSRETLTALLAYCAARTVNAVLNKGDRPRSERIRHADALAAALKLDMSAWYTPGAANFFGRVSRGVILAAIEEAKGVPHATAWEKLKKDELAARAESLVAGTGWLPEPLRIASDATQADDCEPLDEAAE